MRRDLIPSDNTLRTLLQRGKLRHIWQIHELILVPDNGDMNKNYMMQMVCEVNSTEVRPDEI